MIKKNWKYLVLAAAMLGLSGCGDLISSPTGSITFVDASVGYIDTQNFVISDGFTSITFEFDNDSSFTGGNFPISFTGTEAADDFKNALITLINNANAAKITTLSASDGGVGVVNVRNDLPGSGGNIPITTTVTTTGFAVSGMSGGKP